MRLHNRILLSALVYVIGIRYLYCSGTVADVTSCSAWSKTGNFELIDNVCYYTHVNTWDNYLIDHSKFYRDTINPFAISKYYEVIFPAYLGVVKNSQKYYNLYLKKHYELSKETVLHFIRTDSRIQKAIVLGNKGFKSLLIIKNDFFNIVQIQSYKISEFIINSLQIFKKLLLFLQRYLISKTNNPEFNPVTLNKVKTVTTITTETAAVSTLSVTESVTEKIDETNLVTGKPSTAEDKSVDALSKWELAKDEFNVWFRTVEKKSGNIYNTLNKDIEEYLNKKIESWNPELENLFNNFKNETQKHFNLLVKKIEEIECTTSIDPNTKKTIYFNKDGETKLKEYVTRPMISNSISVAERLFSELEKEISEHLIKNLDIIDQDIKSIHNDNIELYEEWADIMISEWSKRMAYFDIMAANKEELVDQDNYDEPVDNYWKNFLKLKKTVIKTRDSLVDHNINLKVMNDYLNKIQKEFENMTKETTEYLLILKTKSNILFEEREKKEQLEQEEQLRKQQEESERIKKEQQAKIENLKKAEQNDKQKSTKTITKVEVKPKTKSNLANKEIPTKQEQKV